MTKAEKIFGWCYLPIHIFVLPIVFNLLSLYVFPANGITISEAHLNFIYYAFGFLMMLIFMNRFLRSSFSDLCDNIINTIQAIILGYAFEYALLYAVSIVMAIFMEDVTNPNSAAVLQQVQINKNVMIAVSVLLAPIVEECLFRATVFGTIRKKSRIAAYIVSALIFSVYHLWQYMLQGFSWTLVIYLLQYIPASIALAWAYEKGRSIWAPIFLHMLINAISIVVSLSL
jgi:hypothetical protein